MQCLGVCSNRVINARRVNLDNLISHWSNTSRSRTVLCFVTLCFLDAMVRGIEGNEMSTPKPKPSLPQSSSNKQKSILGFFQKKGAPTPPTSNVKQAKAPEPYIPTPASSAELLQTSSPASLDSSLKTGSNKENGLPSPVTSPLREEADGAAKEGPIALTSSPSRRVSHYLLAGGIREANT